MSSHSKNVQTRSPKPTKNTSRKLITQQIAEVHIRKKFKKVGKNLSWKAIQSPLKAHDDNESQAA